MSTAERIAGLGIAGLPRAVLSAAHSVVSSVELAVVGHRRVRTSRRNAWEALCADRDLAQRRAEIRRAVAELATATTPTLDAQVRVGSSPRSNASHTSFVAAGSIGSR